MHPGSHVKHECEESVLHRRACKACKEVHNIMYGMHKKRSI